MEWRVDDSSPRRLELKQHAAARLLRWGFSAACVAENTGLSRRAVNRIRRGTEKQPEDDLPPQVYLGLFNSSHDQ
jgi:hypothetical protein